MGTIGKGMFKQITLEDDLQFSEITFDNFWKVYQAEKSLDGVVILYQYKSWRYPKAFDVDSVLSCLRTYLDGNGSFAITARKRILYFTEKQILCGLKIFDEILTQDACMECFLANRNLAGQIHEHYRIILNMLEFIKHIKIINENELCEHKANFQDLVRISARIKYAVFQNEMSPDENTKEKVVLLLRELRQKDESATGRLVQSLQGIQKKDNRE